VPSYKQQEYEVWYRDPEVVLRNMLENPDFDGEFDTTPYVEVNEDGLRRLSDFMSGNYAWRHCVSFNLYNFTYRHYRGLPAPQDVIYEEDPVNNEGAMYVAVILGSDKTTVTVGTGNIEYHPLYFSIGTVHNSVRRAHCNSVVPIGFLAIPKGRIQLFH
jgi:hypothetical protein